MIIPISGCPFPETGRSGVSVIGQMPSGMFSPSQVGCVLPQALADAANLLDVRATCIAAGGLDHISYCHTDELKTIHGSMRAEAVFIYLAGVATVRFASEVFARMAVGRAAADAASAALFRCVEFAGWEPPAL